MDRMSVDYSRFYLVGSRLTGYHLYCLDCDENDLVPFDDSDDDPLDLGQMVRAADRHVAEKHPNVKPDDVWALSYNEYDNSSTVAVFTTQELAEQHQADHSADLGLACHPLLTRRPEKLTLEHRSALVNEDGRVERYDDHSRPQDYWDYEAPEPLRINRYRLATRVTVHAEPGKARDELLRHVDEVLDGYAAECGWTDTMLTAAKMQARWDRPPTPVSRCYRTPSGLAVHVTSGCRC